MIKAYPTVYDFKAYLIWPDGPFKQRRPLYASGSYTQLMRKKTCCIWLDTLFSSAIYLMNRLFGRQLVPALIANQF
jgi:hypothetical protein